MNIIKLITRANILIAFVILVLLFVIYDNNLMMKEWATMIGIRWIWVPMVIILFAAILFGRYFFRKKN